MLTYNEGITRQAAVLGHLRAVVRFVPLYEAAYEARRVPGAPTPQGVQEALAVLHAALRSMDIQDFQREVRGGDTI